MERRIFDPRAGLWLLVAANIIAFRPHTLWLELALVGRTFEFKIIIRDCISHLIFPVLLLSSFELCF